MGLSALLRVIKPFGNPFRLGSSSKAAIAPFGPGDLVGSARRSWWDKGRLQPAGPEGESGAVNGCSRPIVECVEDAAAAATIGRSDDAEERTVSQTVLGGITEAVETLSLPERTASSRSNHRCFPEDLPPAMQVYDPGFSPQGGSQEPSKDRRSLSSCSGLYGNGTAASPAELDGSAAAAKGSGGGTDGHVLWNPPPKLPPPVEATHLQMTASGCPPDNPSAPAPPSGAPLEWAAIGNDGSSSKLGDGDYVHFSPWKPAHVLDRNGGSGEDSSVNTLGHAGSPDVKAEVLIREATTAGGGEEPSAQQEDSQPGHAAPRGNETCHSLAWFEPLVSPPAALLSRFKFVFGDVIGVGHILICQ